MKQLKPCPFCGRPANLVKTPVIGMVAFNCKCSSVVFYGCEKDAKKAIEAWNRRFDSAK